MTLEEFGQDFIESVKSETSVTGEGTTATFVDNMAQYLVDAEVLSDYSPSFYIGKKGNKKYRVDGYVLDEFDMSMNLIIADYTGDQSVRTLTKTNAQKVFGQLRLFLTEVYNSDLHKLVEISTPCADLIDTLRNNRQRIRNYKFYLFTDAKTSASLKSVEIEDVDGTTIDCQIWDLERVFRVCCSEQGRQVIEINFKEYCNRGLPCLEASTTSTNKYKSYLAVIPGTALADIYDKYGSKLLEGNVRAFLSTKVAVNKKIRKTILSSPDMFFAFNNGISATAMNVEIESTKDGIFLTGAEDFQIINGGQTTASISNARYKDQADLHDIYVQMKLTAIDMTSQEEQDELIKNISRSSNSQNKVSDADFFASHPFHRRMEQISRRMYAPAESGAQYETKWFYERARGQYLQEQMRLTAAKKKQFQLQNPKNKVIKKTDLAKVQNTWRMNPHIVSKGAQTNLNEFAVWLEEQWDSNESQFNERYFQTTASLILMFQYLEHLIPKQEWYEGGYRANIIYYTIALYHKLILDQFNNKDLDLMTVWGKQEVPDIIGRDLIRLSKIVCERLTSTERKVINVTQWCKRAECWTSVQEVEFDLSPETNRYLISKEEAKKEERNAKKVQKETNKINAQVEVVGYPKEYWERLAEFANHNNMLTETDRTALAIACQIPSKIPNSFQSRRLLDLRETAIEEGFKEG